MRNLKFALAATTGLAFMGFGSAAHATAYAYANINFTNLSLTGLSAAGVAINSANVTTRDSAGYPDSASASNSAPATNTAAPLTAGSDVAQAYSGPGPAPAQNDYSQALLTTFGTRGDAQLIGNLLTGQGTGANNVAEGHINIPGSGSSTAGTTTGFNIVLTVTGTQSFTLSFNANDNVTATTTQPDEIASASVSSSFTVSQRNANGSSTPVPGTAYSPDALNISTTATSAGDSFMIANPDAFYTTTFTLTAGTYQLSLLSGAQEQVTAPAAVPEPATFALLGAGLVGLGVLRRRAS